MNLKEMIKVLIDIADVELASHIMDEQDRCERRCKAQGIEPDDYSDDTGEPIVYPENAAPELDEARSFLHEAIEKIGEWVDEKDSQ